MNSKLRPVLIGGLVMGLLSGLPYVSLGNLACCLWVVLGGGLATYLYIKQSPTPVSTGEGAVLGLLAGLVGAAVRILMVPVTILSGYPEGRIMINLLERVDPDKAELYRQAVEEVTTRPFFEQYAAAVFSWQTVLSIFVTLVFALVGGLLAAPLFEKRKAGDGGPPPPPPPYYGGTPDPTYAPPPPGDYGPNT